MEERVDEASTASVGINFCGECGYSLVALPGEGRCPECGTAYDVSQEVVVFGRPGVRLRLRDLLLPMGGLWPWFARGSGWRLLGCWGLSLAAYAFAVRNWPQWRTAVAFVLMQLTFQLLTWFRAKFPSDRRAVALAGSPSVQMRVGRRGVGGRRGPGPVGWQGWDHGDVVELEPIGKDVHRLRVRRGRRTQLVGGDPADVVIECDAATAETLRERVEAFRVAALGGREVR